MSYRFIDTHCHFDFPPFTGDESASIQGATDVGVQSIIVPATRAANFSRVLALAENYPPLFAAPGCTPLLLSNIAMTARSSCSRRWISVRKSWWR